MKGPRQSYACQGHVGIDVSSAADASACTGAWWVAVVLHAGRTPPLNMVKKNHPLRYWNYMYIFVVVPKWYI